MNSTGNNEYGQQVWPLVIADMVRRNEQGQEKYNRYLRTDCPDDMLQHLYEELLDACAYIKTLIVKQKQQSWEAQQKEKQEWMSKNIKTGLAQQQYIQGMGKTDSTNVYTSLSDSLRNQAKLQEK